MILTVLQTYYTPRLGSRVLKRKYRVTKALVRKHIRATMRRAKSRTVTAVRSQYFISHAYADLQVAVKRNEDIFINTIIVAFVLGYSLAVTATEIMLIFFQSAFDISNSIGIDLGILILLTGLTISLLFSWLFSFLLNMTSIAIMEGSTLKKYKSVRSTIRKSLRSSARVTNSWLLMAMVIFCPLLLASIFSLIYININNYSMLNVLEFIPFLIIGAVTWIVFVLMNYSLVPYVALFEPKLKLAQTFTRSQQLVSNRGRIFILMGYILMALLLLFGYIASVFIENIIGFNKLILFSILTFSMILAANGIMVALYRKRRLARKY